MISEEPSVDKDLTSRMRPGALCARDVDGHWFYANPGDSMFSSVTMVATHFWKDGAWCKIWEDKE